MTKIKRFFALIIVVLLLPFLCAGVGVTAFAEDEGLNIPETEAPYEPIPSPPEDNGENTEGTDDTTDNNGADALVEKFKEYLKLKYGEEYEFYYAQIIEQWGSIENYLLAFGEKLPEEYKSEWDKFVGWLNDYAPIWAVPLAVIILIIVAVVGKKTFNAALEKAVNVKIKPVVQELNLQSNATVSIMRAQKALLGKIPKFEENVKELEAAEKELTDG